MVWLKLNSVMFDLVWNDPAANFKHFKMTVTNP